MDQTATQFDLFPSKQNQLIISLYFQDGSTLAETTPPLVPCQMPQLICPLARLIKSQWAQIKVFPDQFISEQA
jgi:hypothetical protein